MASSGPSIFKLKRTEKQFWQSVGASIASEGILSEPLLFMSLAHNALRILELNAVHPTCTISLAFGLYNGPGTQLITVHEQDSPVTRAAIKSLSLEHLVKVEKQLPGDYMKIVPGKFGLIIVHGSTLSYQKLKGLLEESYEHLNLGGRLLLTSAKQLDVSRAFRTTFSGGKNFWVQFSDLVGGTLMLVRTMPS